MVLRRLDRYLLRAILLPFIMTMVIAVMLLLLEQMLRLFNFVVNEAGPVDVVWRLLVNQIPEYLGLGMPLGLFVGVLLAFRRFSASSELDAFLNSGLSHWRMMRPIYLLCLPLMALHFALLGYVQPYTQYRYIQLHFEARSGALGAKIDIGEFVDMGDGVTLRVGGTTNDGETLVDLFLERRQDSGHRTAITARRGEFFATEDENVVVMRLYDGSLLDISPNVATPRVLNFQIQDITLTLPPLEDFRQRGGDEREMTNTELIAALQGTAPVPPRADAQGLVSALHWRLVNTLSFLIFPPLAIAMGITEKRKDSGVGMVIGIAAVVVYNEFIEAGETQVADGANPLTAIWLTYAIFGAISFWALHVVANIPGGRPLAPLEWLVRQVREGIVGLYHRIRPRRRAAGHRPA